MLWMALITMFLCGVFTGMYTEYSMQRRQFARELRQSLDQKATQEVRHAA